MHFSFINAAWVIQTVGFVCFCVVLCAYLLSFLDMYLCVVYIYSIKWVYCVCVSLCLCVCVLLILCVCVFSPAALSSTTGSEEEEGGKVRDGGHDRHASHLHCLVPIALHVTGQVCGWCSQQAPWRFHQAPAGGIWGDHERNTIHYHFCLCLLK